MTIRLDQISLTLAGKVVLDAVTASLARGRVTAILGPNGAGKSSLLRVMAGLARPESGKITLDDQPIASMARSERARRIGYLPQEANHVWNLSARDLVALGRLPFRTNAIDDAIAIQAAMAATDTLPLAQRPIDAMSGGERARVHFARILAGNPDWILADEPLANLDPPHQRDILALLRAEKAKGKGIAVVLHGLNAAARVADSVILMRNGVIVAHGPTKDVLTKPNLTDTYGMDFTIIRRNDALLIMPQDAC